MRNVSSDTLASEMLNIIFKEQWDNANHKAYNFMKSIISTPAYWKKVYA